MEAEKFTIPSGSEKPPMCYIVIGMAGSGKTTFINQLQKGVLDSNTDKIPFIVNLDPAVSTLNYTPIVDIRNKIKIKEVMKNYNLGPNGAILTSLNLFSAQFDQVLNKMESKKSSTDMYVVDTPGQIEVFSWSASGSIISQMLSFSFPTTLVYVVDLVRCQNPNTFMSNMLFCCSILYKMRLPMIVVFNKTDVANPEPIKNWLKDYSTFSDDLKGKDNYLSSLSRSLSLTLDEFYGDLNACYLSSVTGEGFDTFQKSSEIARQEYYEVFLPDLDKRMSNDSVDKKKIQAEMEKFKKQFEEDEKLKAKKAASKNKNSDIDIESEGPKEDKKNDVKEIGEGINRITIEDS